MSKRVLAAVLVLVACALPIAADPDAENEPPPVRYWMRAEWSATQAGTRTLIVRISDSDGTPAAALDDTPLTFVLEGGAVFTDRLHEGSLSSTAGTDRASVRLSGGTFAIDVAAAGGADVAVGIDGGEQLGIVTLRSFAPAPEAPPADAPLAPDGLASTSVPDPGQPGPAHTPFELPFAVTDVAFDPLRPLLYASSKSSKAVYVVRLETGLIERVFSFDMMPEALSITPDGSRLFAALLTREHSSGWYDEDGHEGYVASWDLATGVMDRYFRIAEDPYDLVATSSGHLVVSSGSGQWTYIRVFDAQDGRQTGASSWPFQMTRLSLHPSETKIYAANNGVYPSDIERYDLLPGGGIQFRWDSPYHGNHRMSGNVWPTPDGARLITRGGDLYRATDDWSTDMLYLQRLSAGTTEHLAFDAVNQVVATVEQGALRYYNLSSLFEFGSVSQSETPLFIGLGNGRFYTLSVAGQVTLLRSYDHPAPDGASNDAPQAAFEVRPELRTTRTDLTFDASGSTDAEDPLKALRFRWDLDANGTWDTPFRTEPTIVHRFSVAGTKFVRLQVIDQYGLVGEVTQRVDVVFEPDPEDPEPGHPPFELPFAVTDVAFHPSQPYLYASSKANKAVYVVSLETGLIDRVFSFDLMPEALSIAPDGSRLFAGLLTREHSPYWWNEDGHEGYVASWDLATGVMDRYFWIAEDPFDIVATSSGHLVVSSGSGQWTYIRVFDAKYGQQTGAIRWPYERTRISLHPSETKIYAATTGLWPSDIERYDLLPGGGIQYRWESPYHGDYRMDGNVWPMPDGKRLITRGGDLFRATDDPSTDMRYLQSLSAGTIEHLVVDAVNQVVAAVETRSLRYYNLSSLLEIGSVPLSDSPQFVGRWADRFLTLTVAGATTLVRSFDHPAPDGASNAAPRAAFVVRPDSPTTRTEVLFDASGTTDAEDPPAALRFRWDLDADGTWDTPLGAEPTIVHHFPVAGTKFVRLQAVDRYGFAGEVTQQVDVVFEPEPGNPAPDNPPFELPFVVTDVVFDPARPCFYASSKVRRAVYVVRLETGLIERVFGFGDLMPEALSITPDGSRLFAGLLTREHSSSWQDESGHEGYVASWDLATGVMDRYFRIAEDPSDIVATSSGHIVVSSGSGQWTYLRVFDAQDGHETGASSRPYQMTRISLHASETKIYAADTGLSPSGVERYDLLPDGRIEFRWESPYYSGHRMGGDVWPTPDGARLITRGGDVFRATDEPETDIGFLQGLSAGTIEQLVFDPINHVVATIESRTLRYYNLSSLMEFGNVSLSDTPQFVGLGSNRLFTFTAAGGTTTVRSYDHPAPSGAANTAPLAAFEIQPELRTTLTDLTFDASGTADAEDPPAALRFRWDLEADGTWDTPLRAEPTLVHRFRIAGTKFVRLQVVDRYGLASEVTRQVDVVFEPDPGEPGPGHAPFELPFAATDVAFDPIRPYLYASSKANKAVYAISLETGLIERMYRFDHMPEALSIAPDGSRLFAGLLTREHSSYWWNEDGHVGYVASWDLATRTMDRYFRIAEDPSDIVVTSSGHLVVSSGSGQWTYVRVFNAQDGRQTGAISSVYQGTRISLHPSETKIYAADNGLSPPDIERYDLLPGGGIQYRWDSPYHGVHRMWGNVWPMPDGTRLITAGGDLFRATDDPATDMRYLQGLSSGTIAHVAFDTRHDEFFSAEQAAIVQYDTQTLARITAFPSSGRAKFVGKERKTLFGVYSDVPRSGYTRLLGFDVNHPPVAEAGPEIVAECTDRETTLVALDGTASSDPDSSDATNDDITSFSWLESAVPIAQGESASATLGLGSHTIILAVSDASGATATDDVEALVQDTLSPTGSITAPAAGSCHGPGAVPVVVADDFLDACDPDLQRTYAPSPGPSYGAHGDHAVTVTAADRSGNRSTAEVQFTIDLVAPDVRISAPPGGLVLGAGAPPMDIVFTTSDADGATGDVAHELVELDGCVIYDGNVDGDGDGLLSDEALTLTGAELCRIASVCGFSSLRDPLLRVRATDCGANEGVDSRRIRGGFANLASQCPRRSATRPWTVVTW